MANKRKPADMSWFKTYKTILGVMETVQPENFYSGYLEALHFFEEIRKEFKKLKATETEEATELINALKKKKLKEFGDNAEARIVFNSVLQSGMLESMEDHIESRLNGYKGSLKTNNREESEEPVKPDPVISAEQLNEMYKEYEREEEPTPPENLQPEELPERWREVMEQHSRLKKTKG